MSPIGRGAPGPLQPAVAQRDIELEVAQCVGGVSSPLLANIYLSVLDRHFQRVWERDMSPPWRRHDFVVLVHGTQSDAETIRAQIGEVLGRELKMTLSVDKTHITQLLRLQGRPAL
jgi:hypothetical protein